MTQTKENPLSGSLVHMLNAGDICRYYWICDINRVWLIGDLVDMLGDPNILVYTC